MKVCVNDDGVRAESLVCSECEGRVRLRLVHPSDVMVTSDGDIQGLVFCSLKCEESLDDAWLGMSPVGTA